MAIPTPQHNDVELGTLRDGYPALAAWITRDPDNETFVFRKFGRLAARNILHLQSQLIALEYEIDQLDDEARRSNDFEAQQSSRRWETLMKHANDPNNTNRPERERVEKMNELRKLLKEYYELLTLQAQVTELKPPNTRVLTTFRHYVDGNAYKSDTMPSMPIISGRAKEFLSDKGDLIALARRPDEDPISRLLQDHWAFQTRKTSDPLDRTTFYKNKHVVRTVATISMIIAAVLLISAIVSLHVVQDTKWKLGLVATYTLLFALCVATLTNARRAEVFAATAAYAAVLVVFVSGDLGGVRGDQCLIQLEGGYFKTIRCPG